MYDSRFDLGAVDGDLQSYSTGVLPSTTNRDSELSQRSLLQNLALCDLLPTIAATRALFSQSASLDSS